MPRRQRIEVGPRVVSSLSIAVLGLVLFGCSSSSGGGGGTGGIGGLGGEGGSGDEMGTRLRMVHLAPELPTPSATKVDFVVVGHGRFLSIEFSQVTSYIAFDPDVYVVQVNELGSSVNVLASLTAELEVDQRHSVIAYRNSAQPTEMSVMFFEESGEGLSIGHGADDPLWPSLRVVNADTGEAILEEVSFGSVAPVDLPAGDYSVRFDASPPAPGQQAGPFALTVAKDEVLVLVLADDDPGIDGEGVEVYALGPDTGGLVSPLE